MNWYQTFSLLIEAFASFLIHNGADDGCDIQSDDCHVSRSTGANARNGQISICLVFEPHARALSLEGHIRTQRTAQKYLKHTYFEVTFLVQINNDAMR